MTVSYRVAYGLSIITGATTPSPGMVDVMALLAELGIAADASRSTAREIYARCPRRSAHANGDRNPSWHVVVLPGDPKYGSHNCWSCGFAGGPATLAGEVWGIHPRDAAARLGVGSVTAADVPVGVVSGRGLDVGTFRLPPGVVVPAHPSGFPPEYGAYIRWRGIDPAQAVRWGVGYAETGRLRGRVVFVTYRHGEPSAYSARLVDFRPWLASMARCVGLESDAPAGVVADTVAARRPSALADAVRRWAGWFRPSRARYLTPAEHEGAGIGDQLYGYDTVFPPDGPVTLVEGAAKAIVADAAGWPSPVAMFGCALTPTRLLFLSRHSVVYDLTDPDAAGDAARRELAAARIRTVRPEMTRAVDEMSRREVSALRASVAA